MAIFKRKKHKNIDKSTDKLEKALANEKKHIHNDYRNHFGTVLFTWIAPEFIKHEKGAKWYLVWGVIALGLVLYGLFSNAWTFSLVIVVFCAVYYLQHFEHPENIQISITEMGIRIGRKTYPYRHIRAFWIYYMPGHVETLNILTTDKISPEISIQLNGQNPSPIRNYLLDQVPEWEGKEESFTDALVRLLKI